MTDKFRSIKAFKQFEQRSLGVEVEEEPAVRGRGLAERSVSPIRVLAAVKKHPQGIGRRDLAREVGAPLPAVEDALLHLLKEDLVKLRPGSTPDDERILP